MGDPLDRQRDHRLRRGFRGGSGLHLVFLPGRLPGRFEGPVAFLAAGPRPDVGQPGHEQRSRCAAPVIAHNLAPSRVVLPPVLHHVDLIVAEEGHALPPSGGLNGPQLTEASGICMSMVAGLEVLADQWTESPFWSWNLGALSVRRERVSFTPLITPYLACWLFSQVASPDVSQIAAILACYGSPAATDGMSRGMMPKLMNPERPHCVPGSKNAAPMNSISARRASEGRSSNAALSGSWHRSTSARSKVDRPPP